MSKICPIDGSHRLYIDCMECDVKRECKRGELKLKKASQIVIGIDQSYKNTGVSIAADGKLLRVSSIDLKESDDKTWKRREIRKRLDKLLMQADSKSKNKPIVVIERIRMFSKNFVSIDYIKQIGALDSVIVDTAWKHGMETYSVDTRAWKAAVLGTSKPAENDFGVPPEKWPCVEWIIENGFEKSVKRVVEGRRMKGCFFDKNGDKYEYDNDACDSAGIAMSWFCCTPDKFEREV